MPRQKALDAIERAFAAHAAAGGVPEVGQPEIGPQEGNTEAVTPPNHLYEYMEFEDRVAEYNRQGEKYVERLVADAARLAPQDLLIQMVNALAALEKPGVTEADQVVEIESTAVEGAKARYTNVWGRTYYEGEEE